MGIRKLTSALVCAVLAVTLWMSPADAATGDAAGNGPTAEQAGGLEEVLVTARRREERLQDVPISVQALQASTLETLNIKRSEDLNALAAGLSVNYDGNGQSIFFGMRGQTQVQGSPEPGVQVYFDQLPVIYFGADFYDLSQIEVLHGPQGTLFGRNTTGGAVVIRPQGPTYKFEGYVQAAGGNLNAQTYEGAINIPIIADELAVRLSGFRATRDGYVKNIVTGQKLNDEHTDAARAQVLFNPTDRFEDKILVSYREELTNNIGFMPTQPETLATMWGPDTAAFVAPFFPTADAQLAAAYALAKQTHWKAVQSGARTYLRDRNTIVENIASLKVTDTTTLRDIFGYNRNVFSEYYDDDDTTLPLVKAFTTNATQMYTNELQLFGKALDNKLDWIVGGYYQDFPSLTPYATIFTGLGTDFATVANTTSISKAIYTQSTYQFTPKLSLTAGIRQTWDVRSALQGNTFPLTNWTRVSSSAPNWTFSLNYKLQPDTLVYVATRAGYKAGGVNNQASPPVPTSYAPEKLKDVEVGIKTQWALGNVAQRLNLDYYHSWYNGVQTQTSVVEPTGEAVTVLFNAGRAAIDGAEAEYDARFGSAAALTVNYSYTNFVFTEFSSPFPGVSLVGQQQADSPRSKLTVLGNLYAPVVASAGTVYAAAKYSYQSRVVFFTPQFAGAEQSGYGTLDLSLNWDNIMGSSANVSLFGKNVTDKLFFVGGSGGPVPSYSLQMRGEPRTYGIRVRYSF